MPAAHMSPYTFGDEGSKGVPAVYEIYPAHYFGLRCMGFIEAIDDTLAFAIFSIPRGEGLDYIIISSWEDCTLNDRGFLLYM